MALRLSLMLLLLLSSLPALAQGSSLERFQTYVRTTQAARADFDQKVYDRAGKLVQESKGDFAFRRPGLFRWVHAKPNHAVDRPETASGCGSTTRAGSG
jgi:outer membrane lipoprotein carrier protein